MKIDEARSLFDQKLKEYPIVITRDVETAKEWLRRKARGSRRTGIVASSGGRRLRAVGYDTFHGLRGDSNQNELGAWYLNPSSDVRSSNFLEVVATEYAIQGLEIDWAGVLWDADLRMASDGWGFRQFKGTAWQKVADAERRQFILNKYRVLLTRAREGMIIFVPRGDCEDETRRPEFYDDTYHYLRACGIPGA